MKSRPFLAVRMLLELVLAYILMYMAAHLHRYHSFGSTSANVLAGLLPAGLGVFFIADGLKVSKVVFSD
jgi:small neutral amino acid transporter SnatA (MarC family)